MTSNLYPRTRRNQREQIGTLKELATGTQAYKDKWEAPQLPANFESTSWHRESATRKGRKPLITKSAKRQHQPGQASQTP